MQLCKQSARNGKKQSRQDKSAGGRNGKTDLGKGNREAIAAGQINALAMRSKTCFGGNKAAKAAQAADAPVFRRARGRSAFGKGGQKEKKGSDSCRSLFFRLRGSEGCFPDRSALGRRGLRSRGISFPTQWENQAASVSANAALFFRFMVFTTHHCRRLFQKVIRDESILTLFNHFVTSCRLNPRFRDIFLFLYRFAFSPLINSESLSGSRSFCARISCAFYCADLTPSDLKAQSLRFRS